MDTSRSKTARIQTGCGGCLLGVLVALLLSVGTIGAVIYREITPKIFWLTHQKEREQVIGLIESNPLPRTETEKAAGERNQDIFYSQVPLPETHQGVARGKRSIRVAQQGDCLEVAFPIRSWAWGDGTLYLVYRSDTHLDDKTPLTADDFFLFELGYFSEAEKRSPHWYQVSEVW